LDLRALVHALRERLNFFERFPTLAKNIVVIPLKLLVWVANMLIFSAILQLGLLLPMVETFHRVSFAGVGLNALAIPVMTLLLALALPINLLSVVSPAAAFWPAKVLSLIMSLLFGMTHLPGLAAWLSYRMPTPPSWVAWGFCLAFVLTALVLRFARRTTGAGLGACAVFVVLVAVQPFAPRLPRGSLQVTALDCGQGEALFVVFPRGNTMLLDAGGTPSRGAREGGFQGRRWDSGEDIVSPYLWSLGIKKLDVVVLTQPNSDHAGGLYAILENFRVGEFWHASETENPEYAALLEKVAEHRVPTRTLLAGDALSLGGASIRVLWPKPDPPSQEVSTNDDSVVLRISANGMNYLLLGDVSSNAETGIFASREPLENQVLTLGYSTSKSSMSRDYLTRVAPRVVIVTSEADNRREDSSSLVMPEFLRNTAAQTFRTHSDGATTVEAKAGSLVVQTYTGKVPKASANP
jgi:competence protein ComEC